MMQSISKPVRRPLALALLFALVSFAVTTTVLPFIRTTNSLQEQIDQTRELVFRLRSANVAPTGGGPDYEKLLVEAGKRNYIPGDTQNIRMANVQSSLVQILSLEGLKARSIRNLPPRSQAGMSLVGVQAQVGASLAQLKSMLGRIDGQQPRLLIEDLQITRTNQAAADGAPQLLDVRLDVFGVEPLTTVAKAQP